MKTFAVALILACAGAAAVKSTAAPASIHSITLPAPTVELKAGSGRDPTQRYCGICHSVDYIEMQPHFSQAKWGEIVTKMIKVFGAPIPPEVAKEITAYLGTAYGAKE